MRIAAAAAALLGAAIVAGCGSSSPSVTQAARATTTTTVTQTVASGTGSATTSSTSAPATAGGMCRAADLALSFLGGAGATGHGELGFALRNTSTASCATGGYPGVLLLSRSGAPLPTTPTHTTEDFFGTTTLRALTVAPGQTVSFRLGVSHAGSSGSDAGCTTADGLQVIAPNDTATMRVRIPGAGAAECGGSVTVSPLQPGTTAFH